ncbi:MAG TPA: Holliday junction branch migration protein RuvA [Planctomycetota bacterium]|jgi:holliday junction DNA helicase RuvA|nr:Holliday junction branch migration protein RuvA [Planctomycetota bacterium]
MYDHLRGRLSARKPTYLVIEAGGVGYRVDIPLSTYEAIPASGEVTVYTWLKVGEDALRLYGFATERERDLFQKLVDSVNGLGPSRAVAILSNVSVAQLQRAIEEGDVDTLKRVRGIGDKLANRLIVELKGRLPDELTAGKGPESASLERDAASALVALGYESSEAERAVRKARRDLGSEARVEDVIRRSLTHV